jgi:hypothetical protein
MNELTLGGKISHDCGNARSIGWFIEVLSATSSSSPSSRITIDLQSILV